MDYYDIIKRPLSTEKVDRMQKESNKFGFEVNPKANRIQIKKAIEELFQVKVLAVNTMHITGKIKVRGRIIGRRKNWKKAIITLPEGERIDFA